MDRIKRGEIVSWSVLRPMFAGVHEYDYMSIEAFPNLEAITKTDLAAIIEKRWGKDKIESSWAKTVAARDNPGTELWETLDSTDPAK